MIVNFYTISTFQALTFSEGNSLQKSDVSEGSLCIQWRSTYQESG